MPGAGRQRDVDVVAVARVLARLVQIARFAREPAILVDRHRQHIVAVVERLLRAVAVMHIPVERGDPRQPAVGQRVHRGDRDIAEDAEAAPAVALRVVPRRAHQRVGVVHLVVEHRVDGGDRPARREQRDLVAAVAERRALARVAPVRLAHPPDRLDVLGRVKAGDLLVVGRARLERRQLVGELRVFEQVVEAPLGVRVLVVLPGLHPALVGRVEGADAPRVMPHVGLVVNPSRAALIAGRHESAPFIA